MGYDALLLVSFGGPERMDEVMPFLRNVVRGRQVPEARLQEVAHHYEQFGGRSPINEQNRKLMQALQGELRQAGLNWPIYWGNRNWHPLLTDTLKQMQADGVERALAFVTSAYSSYSGCRQYREDIERARAEVGGPAPIVDKLRVFYNHPLFVETNAARLADAIQELPPGLRSEAPVLFTAHSIPQVMAEGCEYEAQLTQTARLVADAVGRSDWKLVFQSRSGPPSQPWLEPDVLDHLRIVHQQGKQAVVLAPIGFVSDHVEVLYDLDHEARLQCDELGMAMVRAQTVGTHPLYVRMIRELIDERLGRIPARCVGQGPVSHDVCPVDCCRPGTSRPPAVVGTVDA